MPNSGVQTCYILSSLRSNLAPLYEVLTAHGIEPLVPTSFHPGEFWGTQVRNLIETADLVIGVVTEEAHVSYTMFELGIARALRKRILLVVDPSVKDFSAFSSQIVLLRVPISNADALGFAIRQIAQAPGTLNIESTAMPPDFKSLGDAADEFLGTVRSGMANEVDLLRLIREALLRTGVDAFAVTGTSEQGADIAVWSDVLEPYVRNPLLIEIKKRLGKANGPIAMMAIADAIRRVSGGWGLLLYEDGAVNEDAIHRFPTVIALKIDFFLEALRDRSFPELIRDLRNERVHGVPSFGSN